MKRMPITLSALFVIGCSPGFLPEVDGGVAVDAGAWPDGATSRDDGGASSSHGQFESLRDAGYACSVADGLPNGCGEGNRFCVFLRDGEKLTCADDAMPSFFGLQKMVMITRGGGDVFVRGSAIVSDSLTLGAATAFQRDGKGIYTLRSGRLQFQVGDSNICRVELSLLVMADGGCVADGGG